MRPGWGAAYICLRTLWQRLYPCPTFFPLLPWACRVRGAHDAFGARAGCRRFAGLAVARLAGAAPRAGGHAGRGPVRGAVGVAGFACLGARGRPPPGGPADRRGRGDGAAAGQQDRAKPESAAHRGRGHHTGHAQLAVVAGVAFAAGPAGCAVLRFHAGGAPGRGVACQSALWPPGRRSQPRPFRARCPAAHADGGQTPGVRAGGGPYRRGAGHVHHAAAPRGWLGHGGGGRGAQAAVARAAAAVHDAAGARRLPADCFYPRRHHPLAPRSFAHSGKRAR